MATISPDDTVAHTMQVKMWAGVNCPNIHLIFQTVYQPDLVYLTGYLRNYLNRLEMYRGLAIQTIKRTPRYPYIDLSHLSYSTISFPAKLICLEYKNTSYNLIFKL